MKVILDRAVACAVMGFCVLAATQAGAELNSKPPETIDFVELTKNPAEWPSEVTLTEKLTWPVFVKGQPVGTMELPTGRKLKLVEVQGNQIKVALGEASQVIPAKATDLAERVLALRRFAAARADAEVLETETPTAPPVLTKIKHPATGVRPYALRSNFSSGVRVPPVPTEIQQPANWVWPHVLRPSLPSGVSFEVVDERGSFGPFLPFEVLQFRIAFEDPDSSQKMLQQFHKFYISSQSTINGRLFPKSLVENNLRARASGKAGKLLNIEWIPVRDLIPPQTGKYDIQVVLDTPKGRWITPLITVEVAIPETDRESLKFLVENGGGDFFSRNVSMRTQSEGDLRQPPYSVIKQFIKTFPDSAFNILIVQQAEHARNLDISQGPNYYLAQDREQLAEIIALAHPEITQKLETQRTALQTQLSTTTDQYRRQLIQKDIAGINRWIALLNKYTQ
jgi:hypothetical protein